MDEVRIRPSQEWVVVLGGHETRIRVIGGSGEIPETWICEDLSSRYSAGTGPHFLVRKTDFVQLERQVE